MFSLVALIVVTVSAGVLGGSSSGDFYCVSSPGHPCGPFLIIISMLACLCIPWLAWLDLSGRTSTGARTPFLSAIIFAVAGPLYFGLLPANLAGVIAHGQLASAPLRFAAEFGLMMFAPLGLMVAPAVRLLAGGPLRRDFTAVQGGWMYQSLTVLMVGLMSLLFVASAGIGGIDSIATDPLTGVWRDSVRVLVPMWFVGMLLAQFALAWGQLGEGNE